jgi:hypothetical protein
MDATRFDDLTKALATSTSRRAAFKTIAATTLAGLLGLGGIGAAFPNCRAPGSKCGENKQCCSHVCCDGVCCGPSLSCRFPGICT